MSLLNPFTGTEIPLPPQIIIPLDEIDEEDSYTFIYKMVLSSRPNDTSNYIVMVICGCDSVLAFWSSGEQTWKKIEAYNGAYNLDVIYHDGRFYAVDYHGFVWAFDVVGNDVQEGRMITLSKGDDASKFYLTLTDNMLRGVSNMYILNVFESLHVITKTTRPLYNYLDSHLLAYNTITYLTLTDNMMQGVSNMYILNVFESLHVITKTTRRLYNYLDSHLLAYNTITFNVYKVDVSTGTWEETNSLGNKAVFIGQSAMTALDASRYHGIIKPNHIYFTDDGLKSYGFHEEKGGGRDMGVYNLETETIEPFYSRERLLSITSPSLWITPHF